MVDAFKAAFWGLNCVIAKTVVLFAIKKSNEKKKFHKLIT